MIRIQNGVGSRDPIPAFLFGLDMATLADLSWTDPALGVNDCAWWPEDDISPPLGEFERYGDESLSIDTDRKVVIVSRAVVPWTQTEIEAEMRARVPQSIPMLNAHLMMIAEGWMQPVRDYIASMTDPVKRAEAETYFDKALTMRRNHALVQAIPAALGKTEAEVDALFIAAAKLEVD